MAEVGLAVDLAVVVAEVVQVRAVVEEVQVAAAEVAVVSQVSMPRSWHRPRVVAEVVVEVPTRSAASR